MFLLSYMHEPISLNKVILIVEDDHIFAKGNGKILESLGYSYIHCPNGETAIARILGSLKVDLVLMDIDLGEGLNGPDTAKEILKFKNLPIVFFSSHIEPEIIALTEQITSYGYITKTSDKITLDISLKMAFKLFETTQSLNDTKNKLTATLKALPDLMLEMDLNGKLHYYHSNRDDLLLVPKEQFIGKYVTDILPPNVSDVAMKAIHEANVSGRSFGNQYEMEVPIGKLWFEVSVAKKEILNQEEPRFIALIRDITDRKDTEKRITSLLSEKEVILKEVHHRIKNNMSMLYSLLSMQATTITDTNACEALEDSARRIKGMALLYDKLFHSANFEEISSTVYLSALIDEIFNNLPNAFMIHVEKAIQDFLIDAKRMQLLGIIVNELITNTIKHAFKNHPDPKIKVSANLNKETISIQIKDNGIAKIINDSHPNTKTNGFGHLLVDELSKQLNGSVSTHFKNGTQVTLEFPA